MPIYEYRCEDCDHQFEILQRIGEGAAGLSCPNCGVDHLVKQFSTFASGDSDGRASATTSGGGCCGGVPN